MAAACPLLVVTDSAQGATLYQDGEAVRVPAPTVVEIDPVGAGDIFAAAFFIHYKYTQKAVEAAEIANLIASKSVTRIGLDSVPTKDEVRESLYSRV
jgi:sugar/nucleoside kinase (ribokinase family)